MPADSRLLAAGLCAAFVTSPCFGHGEDPRHQVPLAWGEAPIVRAVGLGRTLGLRGRGTPTLTKVGDRECVEGSLVGFDVDDAFGFDLDETVTLTLELDTEATPAEIAVGYDVNGAPGRIVPVAVRSESGARFARVEVPLERARFAGRGSFATDLAIAAPWSQTYRLCDLRIERAADPGPQPAMGEIRLRFLDGETPTAARVGLYDSRGRMPLASDEAVPIRHFEEEVRQVAVRAGSLWPHPNRSVFYVDGTYRARVPAGEYELVASKGLEHRIARRRIEVPAGGMAEAAVPLERWADLRKRGWYSGDAHVHLTRGPGDDGNILAQAAAEDLQVTNLLRIGNVQSTYFEQSTWRDAARDGGRHHLVSGQEDPTTGHRGHVLALDLQGPIRHPDRYFLYHHTFDEAHRQGGLVGYAHLPAGWFHVARGLALDVPFGDVDFVEVLQIGLLDVELWYPLLNLGYRMVPAAGSDYPYIDLPGTVRSYVAVEGAFTPEKWFEALRAGRTFVTNGPLLELEVNGRGMGSSLTVERGTKVRVRAEASIHPDWDRLARLELVIHGEVVAASSSEAGSDRLVLEHSLEAEESLWLAVRARGTFEEGWNMVAAHSAPVYLSVDGEPTWKRSAVPEIVDRQLQYLEELEAAAIDPGEDLMYWRTESKTLERWKVERPLLRDRLDEARRHYRQLLEDLKSQGEPAAAPADPGED